MNRMKRMTIGLVGAGLLLGATAARAEEKAAAGGPSPGTALGTNHWVNEYGRRQLKNSGNFTDTPDPEFSAEVQRVADDVEARWDQVLKEIGEGKSEELYTTTAQKLGLLMGIQGKQKGGTIPQSWLDKLEPADRERRAADDRKIQALFQKWAEEDKKAYEAAMKAAIDHNSPEMQFLGRVAGCSVGEQGGGWNVGNLNKAAGQERFISYRVLGIAGPEWTYRSPEQDGRAGAKSPITAGLPRIEEGGKKPGTARTVDLGPSAGSTGSTGSPQADSPQAGSGQGSGVKLDLVWIPAGEFMRGSTWGEKCRRGNENRHRVKLTKGFWMGKYEVTQEQWQRVMGSNPSYFTNAGPKAPVECVRWYDIHEFIRKLSEMTAGTKDGAGGKFRVPTEAEWEWACRAGTDTPLYTGDLTVKGANNSPELDAIAWYAGNSGVEYEGGMSSAIWPDKQYDHRVAGTHPVGQKKPNAWGLYDMLGNVSEWCQDELNPYPSGSVTDPGPDKPFARTNIGGDMIYRGGAWDDCVRHCRPPARDRLWWLHVFRNPVTGFRVVMDEPPVEKAK